MDSHQTPWRLHGLHGYMWGSVTTSKFQQWVQGKLVVPLFGPELKFEPELLRTERKSGPRFEG